MTGLEAVIPSESEGPRTRQDLSRGNSPARRVRDPSSQASRDHRARSRHPERERGIPSSAGSEPRHPWRAELGMTTWRDRILAVKRILNFIDGQFRPPCSGRYLPNVNPATGEVIAE